MHFSQKRRNTQIPDEKHQIVRIFFDLDLSKNIKVSSIKKFRQIILY
jgi:hypothetical protein